MAKKLWTIDAEVNMCAGHHKEIQVLAKTKRLALMKAKVIFDNDPEIFFYMIESCKERN